VDPVTVVAGLGALAGIGTGWHSHRRFRRSVAEAANLRRQLQVAHHAASHDPLTGLPNRRAFHELGGALLADPTRQPLAAAVIDLDDFKAVNDRYGHAAGDRVLVIAAARLATCAGDNLVARLGGDEFAGLLCLPVAGPAGLDRAARILETSLAEPMWIAGELVTVRASVGVAPVTATGCLSDAVDRADAAMYRTKAARRRAACFPDRFHDRWHLPATGAPTTHTHHADELAGG
jgi:diguanylate cyclase